jgi:hypothetical protein
MIRPRLPVPQSLLRFAELLAGNPAPFAISYSLGNLLSISGCEQHHRHVVSACSSVLSSALLSFGVALAIVGHRSSSVRQRAQNAHSPLPCLCTTAYSAARVRCSTRSMQSNQKYVH